MFENNINRYYFLLFLFFFRNHLDLSNSCTMDCGVVCVSWRDYRNNIDARQRTSWWRNRAQAAVRRRPKHRETRVARLTHWRCRISSARRRLSTWCCSPSAVVATCSRWLRSVCACVATATRSPLPHMANSKISLRNTVSKYIFKMIVFPPQFNSSLRLH